MSRTPNVNEKQQKILAFEPNVRILKHFLDEESDFQVKNISNSSVQTPKIRFFLGFSKAGFGHASLF